MKLLGLKVSAAAGGGLAVVAVALIIGNSLEAHHTIKQQTLTNQAVASSAQLAVDKASVALMTQLCNTSDQDKQAEQTTLDTYGDTSPQYQAAKATADKAYEPAQPKLRAPWANLSR